MMQRIEALVKRRVASEVKPHGLARVQRDILEALDTLYAEDASAFAAENTILNTNKRIHKGQMFWDRPSKGLFRDIMADLVTSRQAESDSRTVGKDVFGNEITQKFYRRILQGSVRD
jgi:hypothetical protein